MSGLPKRIQLLQSKRNIPMWARNICFSSFYGSMSGLYRWSYLYWWSHERMWTRSILVSEICHMQGLPTWWKMQQGYSWKTIGLSDRNRLPRIPPPLKSWFFYSSSNLEKDTPVETQLIRFYARKVLLQICWIRLVVCLVPSITIAKFLHILS